MLDTTTSPMAAVALEVTVHFKQLTGKLNKKQQGEPIKELQTHKESEEQLATKGVAKQ